MHSSVLFSCMRGTIAGEILVPMDLEIEASCRKEQHRKKKEGTTRGAK